jgi:hypothetical protein
MDCLFSQGKTDSLRVWCPITILWALQLDGVEGTEDGSSLALNQLDGIGSAIHDLMILLRLKLITSASKDQLQGVVAVTHRLVEHINVLPGVDQH